MMRLEALSSDIVGHWKVLEATGRVPEDLQPSFADRYPSDVSA